MTIKNIFKLLIVIIPLITIAFVVYNSNDNLKKISNQNDLEPKSYTHINGNKIQKNNNYTDKDFSFKISLLESWGSSEKIVFNDGYTFVKEVRFQDNNNNFIEVRMDRNETGDSYGVLKQGDLDNYLEIKLNRFSIWFPVENKGNLSSPVSENKEIIMDVKSDTNPQYVGTFSKIKKVDNTSFRITISNSTGIVEEEIIEMLKTIEI
jgi:hypothetical protein